jgi:DNA replication protein DnaC
MDDPFNPNLRRISEADLPWPHAHAVAPTPPEAPNSKTPAGWTSLSNKPKTANCEQCGDAGYYLLKVPHGDVLFSKIQKCTCAAYHRQIADRAARLGDELGDLSGQTFATFDLERPLMAHVWQGKPLGEAAQRQFLRSAHQRAQGWANDPRGWLYLHGAFGAGKSHLAAAIANAQLGQRVVRFLTVGKLLDILTMTIRDGTTDRLLADLLDCDVLILDELSAAHLAEAASDWRFGRIERIIGERLNKPTVITSNVAPDDLATPGDMRAERVCDRISGASQLIWLPIVSYRRIKEYVS